MVQIKCKKCGAIHQIKKESIVKFKGKSFIIKCKKCQNPIKLIIK